MVCPHCGENIAYEPDACPECDGVLNYNRALTDPAYGAKRLRMFYHGLGKGSGRPLPPVLRIGFIVLSIIFIAPLVILLIGGGQFFSVDVLLLIVVTVVVGKAIFSRL